MTAGELRAAEAQAAEINRLWDEEKLDGRRIAERLGLATRAVNQLLRSTRTNQLRRTWSHFAGPRRIAALLWLNQMRSQTSIADLAAIVGLSQGSIRLWLREDLAQWSAAEKEEALAEFPDPFSLSTISREEQEAWRQVALFAVPGSRSGDGPSGCAGLKWAPSSPPAPRVRRPADVAVFSPRRSVQQSREDQVRIALTAWHLHQERNFTTAQVADILGRTSANIGNYLRHLKAFAAPPATTADRTHLAETCVRLRGEGCSISRVAFVIGRSYAAVCRLLDEAGCTFQEPSAQEQRESSCTSATPTRRYP